MDKARAEGDEKLAKSIQELTFHMNRFGHASALQERKEILSHVYQKAAGYTNLVMIGGYASAFAIWQLTKEHLSTEQSMVVGFMIITSVILFAGFEVFKMISHAFFFRRLNRVLEKEVPEHEHTAAWKSAWDEHQASESRMWALFLTPTVFTGFGTGFYLLWVFATNLANGI
ncbi:MAG: hypothetical protein KZQ85_02860 [Candidatus Thiodiazotropha sp. (ex Myrtea sp. 'scaly one' KF741663)]|nr:hypothetical protein [Candidatus Thiodiazotropha sp. (ex Myrtea sp. 'scaly one' KF741663)]